MAIAFERRNAIKVKARDLMLDTDKRSELDIDKPILTLEELIKVTKEYLLIKEL